MDKGANEVSQGLRKLEQIMDSAEQEEAIGRITEKLKEKLSRISRVRVVQRGNRGVLLGFFVDAVSGKACWAPPQVDLGQVYRDRYRISQT